MISGPLSHDMARTIEAVLIRSRLNAGIAKGIVDDTDLVLEQLRQAGLLNKNRGRDPDRWLKNLDYKKYMIEDGLEIPLKK